MYGRQRTINPFDSRLKVEAFLSWKSTLTAEQKELLDTWANTLVMKLKDCGTHSANELLAEVFLAEHKIRKGK